MTSWEASAHGSGPAFEETSGRANCDGCHTGSGFSDRIAAGITNPADFTTVYSNPTRIDCRACHQIHTTYTKDDFALTTTDPVSLFAVDGATFDGGKGNLCANCHQPRAVIAAPDADGNVKVTSPYWGPHVGPQSAVLLGVGGAGDVAGTPSPHYSVVTDTCVACHMGGDAANHSYTPDVAYCLSCHPGAKDFDMNGATTDLDAKIATLKTALVDAGMLTADNAPIIGTYPAAKADAMWNYILIGVEDRSHGVHNMPYANALIDAALEAMK
jgi:hypothetical protein